MPINGIGSRFVNESYLTPKSLIKILGKPMIVRVIESLSLTQSDLITIIYRSSLDEMGFCDLLKHYFGEFNFNFIPICHDTKGAADTVLRGIASLSLGALDVPQLILDCDTIYHGDIIHEYKKYQDNRIFYFHDLEGEPIYSYIEVDENFYVRNIAEKRKISHYASVGCYGFKNGLLLRKYCEKAISSLNSGNERYISDVYGSMLRDGISVGASQYEKFSCVGTPLQLKYFSSLPDNSDRVLRFCFDIDNTLVTYPAVRGDYSTVRPIPEVISFLKIVKSLGHYIILYTARRMKTHNGNVKAVIEDIKEVTLATLSKFEIPFDEINFGKPYADFYIDDLAIDPKKCLEKQTGFYDLDIMPRDYHTLNVIDGWYKKSGNIQGELFWYNSVPKQLSIFLPDHRSINDEELLTKKVEGLSFTHLFINNALKSDYLEKLLNALDIIHSYPISEKLDNQNLIYLNYAKKLKERFDGYSYSRFERSQEVYDFLLSSLVSYSDQNLGVLGIIHGDPVFTNCFLTTNGKIKFIDPRGELGHEKSIYGDIFYDLSKVYQSLVGYDFIVMGKVLDFKAIQSLKSFFENYVEDRWGRHRMSHIKIITAANLFSLIPLHNNDKCKFYYDLIGEINLDLSKEVIF